MSKWFIQSGGLGGPLGPGGQGGLGGSGGNWSGRSAWSGSCRGGGFGCVSCPKS